jgi:hypothetical protein
MTKSTWTGAVSSDWDDADNWSPAGVPGVDSDVVIASGAAVASASIGTVNSITDSSDLSFESAGTNTVTTTLDNTGHLYVDDSAGEGGTTLNIGGTLTNSNHLVIGNTTLSASDEVTAAALDDTGRIYLIGSAADQALLDVTGSAGFGTAGCLSGYARLAGDSAIEFESGEITSLAAGAHLGLNGNEAFVEDGTSLGSNSALAGLASIGLGASLSLHDEAAVSTDGALVNDGHIRLDVDAGNGGSSLTLAGALTNSGSLSIGNTTLSASDEVTAASLDNTGKIYLRGSGANQALLDVIGSAGFVNDGTVFLEDKAAVSTTAGFANVGTFQVDANPSDGGSSLTVGGTLTNGGFVVLGNPTLSAPDEVTAPSLDNTGTLDLIGTLDLVGSNANQALVDVTGKAGFGADGVLSGSVLLTGGDDAIDFASGQITTIAAGASLELDGNDAFIGQHSARIEQRPDWARQRLGVPLSRGCQGIDDWRTHQ